MQKTGLCVLRVCNQMHTSCINIFLAREPTPPPPRQFWSAGHVPCAAGAMPRGSPMRESPSLGNISHGKIHKMQRQQLKRSWFRLLRLEGSLQSLASCDSSPGQLASQHLLSLSTSQNSHNGAPGLRPQVDSPLTFAFATLPFDDSSGTPCDDDAAQRLDQLRCHCYPLQPKNSDPRDVETGTIAAPQVVATPAAQHVRITAAAATPPCASAIVAIYLMIRGAIVRPRLPECCRRGRLRQS